MVATWRLLGLESPADLDILRSASSGITFHCDPGEEAGALGGIKRLLLAAEAGASKAA